jgi:hypothetical protein
VNAKLARYLRDLGLGADEIVGALEAVESGMLQITTPHEETPADRKRARDAARMREKRLSRDVAATVASEKSAKEIPPIPPKENNYPLSPTGTVPRGQHALPKDFTITESVYAYAAGLNPALNRAEADDCLEAMRNWAWGKAIRRADWVRTLYNFFRDASKQKAKAGTFRGARNANSSTAVDWAFSECRRLAEQEQLSAVRGDAESGFSGGLLPRTGTG